MFVLMVSFIVSCIIILAAVVSLGMWAFGNFPILWKEFFIVLLVCIGNVACFPYAANEINSRLRKFANKK